ncbi:MAG: LuxR C-terminal-related transcriptional regulator [Gordonibacter sp.]|uniref:helix-turn-helix transcriptional regulator n=1 Tax=Gordonibacter sp. TaxID=1968902 RepID=UPI002FCB98C2
MAEQSAMPQEGWIERHPLLVSTLGYGIVCGLTFPLMISSTFLKEMSLSHGAGNSFGTLFFLAYAITMIATAATHLFRRKRIHRRRMVSAFGAVFLGNVVMLVRYLGHLSGEWPYAVLAAGLIGYGLATTELGWMARIATLRDEGRLALERAVPLAFACGAGVAAIIFLVTGTIELSFALAITALSSLPLMRNQPLEAIGRRISFSKTGVFDFVKAISYLAVFSFVFGAVSQVATNAEADLLPIEAQAVLGIVVAAAIMFAGSLRTSKRQPASDLYDLLFPVVAVALIALPFITSQALHIAAAVLVFVAYYLSSMNLRIILCQLATRDNVSMWVYLSVALGVGSLLILGGVAFGAAVLTEENLIAGLALVSLVSLFVLALNPIVAARLERHKKERGTRAEEATPAPEATANPVDADGTARTQSPALAEREVRTALMRTFSELHGFTPREAEVLELLCQGRTRTYIAAELGLSPNTVKGYIHNVYQKSGSVDKQDLLDRVELFIEKH